MITFVKSQWAYSECHQWLRCFIHLYLPIAWLKVQCHKPNSPIQTVQSIFNLWEATGIFDHAGIQISQMNAKLELTILLTYQYNGASISFRCSLTSSYILDGIHQHCSLNGVLSVSLIPCLPRDVLPKSISLIAKILAYSVISSFLFIPTPFFESAKSISSSDSFLISFFLFSVVVSFLSPHALLAFGLTELESYWLVWSLPL